jgi:hypothetical protein
MRKTTRTHDAYSAARHCPLSRFERLTLAVTALGVDERTVIAAYTSPASVRESSLRRIQRAAAQLGYPLPSFPSPERGE